MNQQPIPVTMLDPEQQAAHHASVIAANDRRALERVAAENRKAGHARPEPGDRFYVTTMRGISRRGRAGVRFSQESRTNLIVIGGDSDSRVEVPDGFVPISVDGAEAILHDDALNVSARPATDAEAADLRSQLADRDAELAALRRELEAAKREARQSAAPDPQGGPARLNAARKVKATDPDGFGGKD